MAACLSQAGPRLRRALGFRLAERRIPASRPSSEQSLSLCPDLSEGVPPLQRRSARLWKIDPMPIARHGVRNFSRVFQSETETRPPTSSKWHRSVGGTDQLASSTIATCTWNASQRAAASGQPSAHLRAYELCPIWVQTCHAPGDRNVRIPSAVSALHARERNTESSRG